MATEIEIKNLDPSSIIIGFTGSFGSGCTLLSKTFAEVYGYKYYCLSDYIKEFAKEKSLPSTRESFQDVGNNLREDNSPHFLAVKIIEQIDHDCEGKKIDKIVIDSIRNDFEVKYLQQFPKFYLISIYRDEDQRFNELSKKDDTYTRQKFSEENIRDANEYYRWGQKVAKCNYLSDIVINNNKQLEDIGNARQKEKYIQEKFGQYVKLIQEEPDVSIKPDKDTKSMTIAYLESMSSRCIQRKVGAVIANKDGDIVSTGFNDPPDSEGGCFDEYGMCYRKYLKENKAKDIKYCPSCGEHIIIKCNQCNNILASFTEVCPTCNQDIKFLCSKCDVPVFEKFSPGGKQFVGKLLDICRSLHAEENAILKVQKINRQNLKNLTLYTTTFPCNLCANKIVKTDMIDEIVYNESYTMPEARKILDHKGIKIRKFEGIKSSAFFKFYNS
jgi:deoxycytidylate deaminase/cytidylate kinase